MCLIWGCLWQTVFTGPWNSMLKITNRKWFTKPDFFSKPISNVYYFFRLESEKGEGVCPLDAQSGHFHLNRGPRVASGVTLATVKSIVKHLFESREQEMTDCYESELDELEQPFFAAQDKKKKKWALPSWSSQTLSVVSADTVADCQSILILWLPCQQQTQRHVD